MEIKFVAILLLITILPVFLIKRHRRYVIGLIKWRIMPAKYAGHYVVFRGVRRYVQSETYETITLAPVSRKHKSNQKEHTIFKKDLNSPIV